MNTPTLRLAVPLVLLLALAACGGSEDADVAGTDQPVSGHIEDGLRVLIIEPDAADQHFTIYRGDYVRPERTDGVPFVLEIPALGVSLQVPTPDGERPYFKVPEAGSYDFVAGPASGVIEAVEYQARAYREVTPQEAQVYLAARHPLVLDVRTPAEYAAGHLRDAELIPVQQLQQRLGELADRKDEPVFVYCRTGNRSTVAAKMLVDAGHTEVVNLRHGIVAWEQAGLPVVK